jgi:peptidoglycan/xylan/chitin deacetylase (PgdA/CDA1 family)
MDVLVDCILNQTPFPKNAVVLTFDDGYADNYRAAELLHSYGLTGIFYITAGCIETQEHFWGAEIRYLLEQTQRQKICLSTHGYAEEVSLGTQKDRADSVRKLTRLLKTVDVRSREEIRQKLRRQLDDALPCPNDLMLTWQQLKEMVAMGMEIGGHTMTHCNLPNAQEHEAWFEITQCKALLERQLEVQVRHFAYPNGGSVQHYNNQVKALMERAGFRSACTSKSGFVGPKCDRLELPRVRASENVAEMVWGVETARWQGKFA